MDAFQAYKSVQHLSREPEHPFIILIGPSALWVDPHLVAKRYMLGLFLGSEATRNRYFYRIRFGRAKLAPHNISDTVVVFEQFH